MEIVTNQNGDSCRKILFIYEIQLTSLAYRWVRISVHANDSQLLAESKTLPKGFAVGGGVISPALND